MMTVTDLAEQLLRLTMVVEDLGTLVTNRVDALDLELDHLSEDLDRLEAAVEKLRA